VIRQLVYLLVRSTMIQWSSHQ